jgi:serine/threonine-protein kinase RsbW
LTSSPPAAAASAPRELAVRAEAADVRLASLWLEREALAAGVPADQVARLDACLNEVLANVIAHGGVTARSGPVLVRLESGPDEAGVTVIDAGIAFDPVAYVPRPFPGTLDEAEPGGLGVVMIRKFSDEVAYERRDGANRLTFRVRWEPVRS